jgi:hypothetical protein
VQNDGMKELGTFLIRQLLQGKKEMLQLVGTIFNAKYNHKD